MFWDSPSYGCLSKLSPPLGATKLSDAERQAMVHKMVCQDKEAPGSKPVVAARSLLAGSVSV